MTLTAGRPAPITPEPVEVVRRAVFTQRWDRLTYLHWPYEPAEVARVLPAGLVPDTFDGAAWVGLIPFHMQRVTIFGTPPLPYLATFHETNVRTYTVAADGTRAVTFLSLDASRLLPVLAARVSYRLPYCWARMGSTEVGGELTATSTRRWPAPRGASDNHARSRIRVELGAEVEASELDHFLTARWGLHTAFLGGIWYAPVAHTRWPLRAARLLDLDEDLMAATGLPTPRGEPRVLYSPGVDVRIGRPRRVRD